MDETAVPDDCNGSHRNLCPKLTEKNRFKTAEKDDENETDENECVLPTLMFHHGSLGWLQPACTTGSTRTT